MELNLSLKKEDLIRNKQLIIGVSIGLIAFWYGYNKIYKPGIASIRKVKAEIHSENLNTDVSKRIAVLQNELEGYKNYFGKETDVSWLIDRVSKAANESGLKIISLNAQPQVSLNHFFYNTIKLTTSGTFHQLGDFAAKIENSKEVMRIEQLSFNKVDASLNANVVVSIYFWNS